MAKKTLLLIVLFVISISSYAQSASTCGLKTKKHLMSAEVNMQLAYATGLGNMNNFLSSNIAKFNNMRMLQGGIGYQVNFFFLKDFAIYLRLNALRGNDFSANDNIHAKMNTWEGLCGLEYYFFTKNNIQFSTNIGFLDETIDFDYEKYNGYWCNYGISIGMVFWYKNSGIALGYAPMIIKNEPKETITMYNLPKMARNNISLTFRLRF